ncbi:MAG: AmmeMemoRadiSam system radical SAM enzyme [bacterium]
MVDPTDKTRASPSADVFAGTLTRRSALKYAIAGLAGLACTGSCGWLLLRRSEAGIFAETSGIFKGDAPKDELWEQWNKRGWVREARHYVKIGPAVMCKLCPNHCRLSPGDRSRCRNKINRGGTLQTLAYANPCAFHVDPVEKKPLFHFHPGTRTFSLATAGCVLRCLNCQNWDISQKKPEETKDPSGQEYRLHPDAPQPASLDDIARLSMFPEDVAAMAQALKCPSISYTYSEPVAYYEYAYDTCKLARDNKLKNILVTSGYIEEVALRDIAQYVDAAHVDLKGFDEQIYQQLNSGSLQPVLNTLKTLKSVGVWFEIINLIVPTYTDKEDVIQRMCGWLTENIGADVPLHFSRFSPAHKLTQLPPTPVEKLLKARSIAQAAGLRYVYIGNVRGVEGAETTFCPNCKKAVVVRDMFAVTAINIENSRCAFCKTLIAGVWSDGNMPAAAGPA